LKTTGSSIIRIFTLAVCLTVSQGWAATKPWVILTNCQYLANAEGDGASQAPASALCSPLSDR